MITVVITEEVGAFSQSLISHSNSNYDYGNTMLASYSDYLFPVLVLYTFSVLTISFIS